MTENIKLMKCFVASPSDRSEERLQCDKVVEEINSRLGDGFRVHLQTVRWEKDAIPAIGESAQCVLNEQLQPEHCHFFVGIFGGRIGTPTKNSESGSIEEFERAYEHWKLTKDNQIMIFFKKNEDLANIDIEQLRKVLGFKKRIQELGVLYYEYENVESFGKVLTQAMEKTICNLTTCNNGVSEKDAITARLATRLNDALKLFSESPVEWIDRTICPVDCLPESLGDDESDCVSVVQLLDEQMSCIVVAPPQFGLTCLSHYLILQAWKKRNEAWAYLDFSTLKLKKIENALAETKLLFNDMELSGIIVDSWDSSKPGAQKIFEKLDELLPTTRLIVMQASPDALEINIAQKLKSKRTFKSFQLLSLTREDARKAVSLFVERIGSDENIVLSRIMSDMEALNIHRTPMNCWTLLTVAEKDFRENPVNRAQMLNQVLFILFELGGVSDYSSRPDVKDCEQLLGYFCEWILKEGKEEFSQKDFISKASAFYDEHVIDVDAIGIFNILSENKIFIRVVDGVYRFGAAFWIHYFAAKRMDSNKAFRDYILTDKQYVKFPEIIEFYTGITRNDGDVLTLLSNDFEKIKDGIAQKIGVEKNLNPLAQIKWCGNEKDIERMQERLNSSILKSNVPDVIKDRHADKEYDYRKPYNQSVEKYIEDMSFQQFYLALISLSRALRNSDYCDFAVRKRALDLIVRGWMEMSKTFFVLASTMADSGSVIFGGTRFRLARSFMADIKKPQDRIVPILMAIPSNVIRVLANDVMSQRMGPLFYKALGEPLSELARHLIMRYLVFSRPRDWERQIGSYIHAVGCRSFYQEDIRVALVRAFRYDYHNVRDGELLKRLAIESTALFSNKPVRMINEAKLLGMKEHDGDGSNASQKSGCNAENIGGKHDR